MRSYPSVFIYAILMVGASTGLSVESQAAETCSAELRKDLDFLLVPQNRSQAEGLKDLLAKLDKAPTSVKAAKEPGGFCDQVKAAGNAYIKTKNDILLKLNEQTRRKLSPTDAYLNSSAQLLGLQALYCENPDCKDGWLNGLTRPENCKTETVQTRLKALQGDIPRITALFQKIEETNRSCGQAASMDWNPQNEQTARLAMVELLRGTDLNQSLSRLAAQEPDSRKVTDRDWSPRVDPIMDKDPGKNSPSSGVAVDSDKPAELVPVQIEQTIWIPKRRT
jgi:hypothetical protein